MGNYIFQYLESRVIKPKNSQFNILQKDHACLTAYTKMGKD